MSWLTNGHKSCAVARYRESKGVEKPKALWRPKLGFVSRRRSSGECGGDSRTSISEKSGTYSCLANITLSRTSAALPFDPLSVLVQIRAGQAGKYGWRVGHVGRPPMSKRCSSSISIVQLILTLRQPTPRHESQTEISGSIRQIPEKEAPKLSLQLAGAA